MERTDKDTSPLLFELVFTQLKNCSHYFTLNCLFIALQFALLLAKLYTLVRLANADRSEHYSKHGTALPHNFHRALCAAGSFSGADSVFEPLLADDVSVGLWVAVAVGAGNGVYRGERAVLYWQRMVCRISQIPAIGLRYACGVHGCRVPKSAVLLPLPRWVQSAFHVLSSSLRNSGQSVLFLLAYSALISLSTNPLFISNITAAQQLTFFLTCGLYAVVSTPPQASPALARIFSVCSLGLLWTSGLIWLAPML